MVVSVKNSCNWDDDNVMEVSFPAGPASKIRFSVRQGVQNENGTAGINPVMPCKAGKLALVSYVAELLAHVF